jgi:hypothetical protein
MITDGGRLHIKRYLSRQVGTIGGAVALGISSTPASVADTRLGMEITRADVSLVTYDFTTDRLIFKAAIPNEFSGKIYEIGLWSLGVDNMAGNYGSRGLAAFEDFEAWSTGAWDLANARVGTTALRVTAAANGTSSTVRSNVTFDFSGHSSSDAFLLAYYVNNPYVSSVRLRLSTDASNYYLFTVAAPQPGYNVSSLAKGSAAVTGTPTWSNITSIQLDVVANAGGAAVVDFDALRVEDVDPYNPDYVLVAREVLLAPLEKVAGRPQEVEFSMAVDV